MKTPFRLSVAFSEVGVDALSIRATPSFPLHPHDARELLDRVLTFIFDLDEYKFASLYDGTVVATSLPTSSCFISNSDVSLNINRLLGKKISLNIELQDGNLHDVEFVFDNGPLDRYHDFIALNTRTVVLSGMVEVTDLPCDEA